MNKSSIILLLCIIFSGSNLLLANPKKVVNDNSHSGYGYYNTCPESPNGQKIAYTKMLNYSGSDRSAEFPAELWICNRDLSGHEKIFNISKCSNHNFSTNVWIDNTSANSVSASATTQAAGGSTIYSYSSLHTPTKV